MNDHLLYHDGSRQLQDAFHSRRIADRLAQVTLRTAFTDDDKAFIETVPFFFLATADADGRPDCSFKGGMPGFVQVAAPNELLFPDYDGNGMFKSLGNVAVNTHVGLLFIAMGEKPKRLRVNGDAVVHREHPMLQNFPGAQMLISVTARAIFPNCPRYIPSADGPSPYSPRPGYEPPEPAWKSFDVFKEFVHPRQPTPK